MLKRYDNPNIFFVLNAWNATIEDIQERMY